MRRPVVRLIAAWFERRIDAEAARDELGALQTALDLKLRVRRLDEHVTPAGAHPILVARVPAAHMPSVRRIVSRHRGQIVIDLDERYARS